MTVWQAMSPKEIQYIKKYYFINNNVNKIVNLMDKIKFNE